MILKMRATASIFLFCAYFVFGFVTGAMRRDRYLQEIDAMPKNLSVHDDNGNPVEITMEQGRQGKWFTGPVTFTLYTRDNRHTIERLVTNDRKKLQYSHFDNRRLTRFITHGWTQSGLSPSCLLIRDAYLEANDDNVIVVDWSGTSQTPYIWASSRVKVIGKEVAQMINFLVEKGRLNANDVTLVGHSLGAHVMGLAGYHSKYKVRHIVGLDPALPMFNFAWPTEMISTLSGNHVEIIHTNAGILGYLQAVGHSDFYPNGGTAQRGCCNTLIPLACSICSHDRAYEFFAESISSHFVGVQCNNYMDIALGFCKGQGSTTNMGGPSINLANSGMYYVATSFESPFSRVR